MARPKKEPTGEKPAVVNVDIGIKAKQILRLLHTDLLNSDRAVIIDLIMKEGKRRKISIPE